MIPRRLAPSQLLAIVAVAAFCACIATAQDRSREISFTRRGGDPPVIARAAAPFKKRDCCCQCISLTYHDEYGTEHGNCMTTYNGARWCYVQDPAQFQWARKVCGRRRPPFLVADDRTSAPRRTLQGPTNLRAPAPWINWHQYPSTCPDRIKSNKFPWVHWSYNACTTPGTNDRRCKHNTGWDLPFAARSPPGQSPSVDQRSALPSVAATVAGAEVQEDEEEEPRPSAGNDPEAPQ